MALVVATLLVAVVVTGLALAGGTTSLPAFVFAGQRDWPIHLDVWQRAPLHCTAQPGIVFP